MPQGYTAQYIFSFSLYFYCQVLFSPTPFQSERGPTDRAGSSALTAGVERERERLSKRDSETPADVQVEREREEEENYATFLELCGYPLPKLELRFAEASRKGVVLVLEV